ncbi:MAG: glycine betaine ABC transporter substrate-binding protein [Spirochaetaceae bacterium]|nr:MAG: glycine betaine ABC transporter substrate-binding protein [Spirochaetaceae bacterium]
MKITTRFIALALVMLLASTAVFAGGAAEDTKTARLTYVNWEEGIAWTHLVKAILEDEMGYDVEIIAADVGPAYAAVAAGDADAFMEAWLPGLHATYMDELGDDLIDLGIIYEDAVSGLVVPQYMADAGVTTLSDLADPEVVDRLGGQITGIDAGAGLMITTEEQAMPKYGLDEAGLELVPSSGPAMMAALDTAVQNEEWIVVLGWQPHSKFGYYDLVILEQDQEMIWDIDNVHLIGRTGLREDKPELAEFLGNMFITNDQISDLMVHINESNLDTLEAAREWKDANSDVWSSWIPSS